jgi:outer membrane protein OmpA-like peptidoglycan-associated protein
MRAIKFLFVIVALLFVCGTVQAQFGKRLGKAIENAAKKTVERKAEQKTEEAVSKGIDKATDPNTYKDKDGGESKDGKKSSSQKQSGNDGEGGEPADVKQDAPKGAKAAEMAYAKSDFVPGDEIMFEDNQANEQLGEFPSMWDLKGGNAEIAKISDENCINLVGETTIMPFMKEKDYLPDVFTIEFDIFASRGRGEHPVQNVNDAYYFYLQDAKNQNVFELSWYLGYHNNNQPINIPWKWKSGGENNSGKATYSFKWNDFNHVAISFNKRALKVYLNGTRVVNIPRCDASTKFVVNGHAQGEQSKFIKNVRIAKGAVPLYDRMMTDGKIITYGITFDIGKSTIKPESMGEINRIAKLMQDNPDLKFSVEGHTDNTGSAATNQTLSDARSKAVLDKLVEMGVAKDRLSSAGKGQNSPIADNTTDEGKAKNRRVEFVKVN